MNRYLGNLGHDNITPYNGDVLKRFMNVYVLINQININML